MTIFTIGQSFVKSIGVFPGVRGTLLKIRLGLKELKRFKHFKKDKGWRWSVISKDGSIHLPTLVAIVVAALGALTIFALCIWYKTTRKIGLKCCAGLQKLDDNVSRTSGSSTETTSEHIYSNDGPTSR